MTLARRTLATGLGVLAAALAAPGAFAQGAAADWPTKPVRIIVPTPPGGPFDRLIRPIAQDMAAALMDEGVYVTGFSFPVVPKGQARIRTQMCAGHCDADVDAAVAAFAKVGRELKIV